MADCLSEKPEGVAQAHSEPHFRVDLVSRQAVADDCEWLRIREVFDGVRHVAKLIRKAGK